MPPKYLIAFPHSLVTFDTADEAHKCAMEKFKGAAKRIQHIDIYKISAVGVVECHADEKEIA